MPLIWTDETDKVVRKHHKPEQLSEHQRLGSIPVEEIPTPDNEDDKYAVLYYTEDDGFHHEYRTLE